MAKSRSRKTGVPKSKRSKKVVRKTGVPKSKRSKKVIRKTVVPKSKRSKKVVRKTKVSKKAKKPSSKKRKLTKKKMRGGVNDLHITSEELKYIDKDIFRKLNEEQANIILDLIEKLKRNSERVTRFNDDKEFNYTEYQNIIGDFIKDLQTPKRKESKSKVKKLSSFNDPNFGNAILSITNKGINKKKKFNFVKNLKQEN